MIHYHGTPISGAEKNQMALSGKHAFISFAASQHIELIAEICQSFAIDNGAYSAWTSGKHFDLDGFGFFLETWHRHPSFDWYILPDVIGGDHLDNEELRNTWRKIVPDDIWAKGVPVWHLHEPIEVLRDMVNLGMLYNQFPRVAFGSGDFADVGTPQWWNRMAQAMEVGCDEQGRPKVKLHGLKMLDPSVFSHLPLASADSTNVARNCGIDKAWKGPYSPATSYGRALVMMERIEMHASAARWSNTNGINRNLELFG